jgi:hypothetical protein
VLDRRPSDKNTSSDVVTILSSGAAVAIYESLLRFPIDLFAEFDRLMSGWRRKGHPALAHLKTTHPRKKKLFPSLLSFAATVTACAMPKRKRKTSAQVYRKTRATQRMKPSAMRWRHRGGPGDLDACAHFTRATVERAWKFLSSTDTRTIEIPESVVAVS